METDRRNTGPTANDYEVGDNADPSGIAQPIRQDDVDAIMVSAAPVQTRRVQLEQLRRQITTRDAGDFGDDMDALLVAIERAITSLDAETDTEATRDDIGMDPGERLDTAPPDEFRERLRDKS